MLVHNAIRHHSGIRIAGTPNPMKHIVHPNLHYQWGNAEKCPRRLKFLFCKSRWTHNADSKMAITRWKLLLEFSSLTYNLCLTLQTLLYFFDFTFSKKKKHPKQKNATQIHFQSVCHFRFFSNRSRFSRFQNICNFLGRLLGVRIQVNIEPIDELKTPVAPRKTFVRRFPSCRVSFRGEQKTIIVVNLHHMD